MAVPVALCASSVMTNGRAVGLFAQLNRVTVAACCAMLWSVTTGLAADHAQNRDRCPCVGLNYDRNIVQFYGVCLQEGSPPMLICEVQQPSLLRRHLARPPFLQSHCRGTECP